MSKHTPGPWKVKTWAQCSGTYGIEGQDVVFGTVTREADARLIAAAPELVEALREVMDAASHAELMQAKHSARAILAKCE